MLQFGSWGVAPVGVGWGSGPLGGDTQPPPSSAVLCFIFFLAAWPFLAIRKTRALGFRTDDDERNRATPKPLFQEQKIAKILSPFYLAIFKNEPKSQKTATTTQMCGPWPLGQNSECCPNGRFGREKHNEVPLRRLRAPSREEQNPRRWGR